MKNTERKKEIGEQIKYFRQKRGLTQEEFAKLANITRIALGNYERGERTPTIEIFERIARALYITTDELLGNTQTELTTCLSFCEDYGYTVVPLDIKKKIDEFEKSSVPYLEKYYDPTQYIYLVKAELYSDWIHNFSLRANYQKNMKRVRKKDIISIVKDIKQNEGIKILIHDLLENKVEASADLDYTERQIQDISYFYSAPIPKNITELAQSNIKFREWITKVNQEICNKYFQGRMPSPQEFDDLNHSIVSKWPKFNKDTNNDTHKKIK